MSVTHPFQLAHGADTLHGLLDLPDGPPRTHPTVVVCHGFKGFMEWGFWPSLATLLAERGFLVVRFNLTGSGMQPGDETVTGLEAFRRDTYRSEREELLAVLGSLEAIAPGRVDTGRIALLGHSRGGAEALLAAAHPDWRDRIRALVTWGAIAEVDRFTPEQKERWRRDGELPVVNSRTGQLLFLGPGLLAELEGERPDLDLEAAARARRAPWLIVHGTEDDAVPVADGHRLAAAAADPKELVLIPGGGHTFNVGHPFKGPSPQLIQTLNATQRFLRANV